MQPDAKRSLVFGRESPIPGHPAMLVDVGFQLGELVFPLPIKAFLVTVAVPSGQFFQQNDLRVGHLLSPIGTPLIQKPPMQGRLGFVAIRFRQLAVVGYKLLDLSEP